jgi:quinol monooxygenase YgiN
MRDSERMTFAYAAAFPVQPGSESDFIALLGTANPALADAGCLRYDIGVDPSTEDTVFVHEVGVSKEAHDASLTLASTQAAIAQAMPLIAGRPTTSSFEILGSPLS